MPPSRQTRRRVALELVADLEKIYQRSKALDKEIKQLVTQVEGRVNQQ